MPKKKKQSDAFTSLTWNDLEEWAGGKIVSRGKNYQRQGHVIDLAVSDGGSLVAWVKGSRRYATKVEVDSDGLPNSICTCPYEFDCKHGVAVVLEYLSRLEKKQRVPKANENDERVMLLADEGWEDEEEFGDDVLPANIKYEIDAFLKSKTKVQLIDLIATIAEQHPEIAQDILDLKLLNSGDVKAVVARVRQEIRDIGEEAGWQNYWSGEGYTPDYSAIRNKLETLLEKGHADDVLTLGEELIACGIRQIEQCDDHGETQMEIADCMPVILKALTHSSLALEGKLAWAMDAVLKDDFELCEVFTEYLYRKHTSAAWSDLADRLLERLKAFKLHRGGEYDRYERDRISDWVVHALDRSRRNEEIIPLCETEAPKTGSYERLVKRLIADKRYEEAEQWIYKGVQATGKKWPGIAANLRAQLRNIRTRHKDWPAVAALQVYEFIDRPSQAVYSDCKKAAEKAKVWTFVRERLLMFLETGSLPWHSKNWPLPETGFETPEKGGRRSFPEFDTLIDIAIYEKLPDRVLHWYDRRPKQRFDWYGSDDDRVAAAIQNYAPERAVEIWQKKAEGLIAQVKPSAYKDAAKYLRKASKVMNGLKKQTDWQLYLQGLKQEHARKRRLMEVLEDLQGKPILKRKQKYLN